MMTSEPSSSVPAPSFPRIIGKTMGSACAVTPIKVKMSCRFRLAWETFTRTQPSGTTGSGRSPTASEASGFSIFPSEA